MSSEKVILGIDPGVGGGLAILRGARVLDAFPMPIVLRKQNDAVKKFIDPYGLHEILAVYPFDECWIELVHASPQMGVTSAFNFGRSSGTLFGAVAHWVPSEAVHEIAPSVWKPALGCTSDKKQTVARALFPKAGGLLVQSQGDAVHNIRMLTKPHRRGKNDKLTVKDFHDGMTEAALIAKFGQHRATSRK